MFTVEHKGNAAIVTIDDELDARNAQQAREFFKDLIAKGSTSLVVDLSPLTFIDSSGLGALVTAHKLVRQENGAVRLCGLTPTVRSIFEITRLTRAFDIVDTVDDALAKFA